MMRKNRTIDYSVFMWCVGQGRVLVAATRLGPLPYRPRTVTLSVSQSTPLAAPLLLLISHQTANFGFTDGRISRRPSLVRRPL